VQQEQVKQQCIQIKTVVYRTRYLMTDVGREEYKTIKICKCSMQPK
jgi:hypothetical protein